MLVRWPGGRSKTHPAEGPFHGAVRRPTTLIEESRLMTMADTAMPFAVPSEPPATRTAPPPAATQLAAPAPPLAAPTAPGLGVPDLHAPDLNALPPIPVSATLAANETLARKRRAGEPVLPLAFGEAGLPTHPLLRDALGAASG